MMPEPGGEPPFPGNLEGLCFVASVDKIKLAERKACCAAIARSELRFIN